ncbi:MAG TPA: tetratricopeptide repeat-containing protein kinase family protein [Verrucomicrobiae bacterium]
MNKADMLKAKLDPGDASLARAALPPPRVPDHELVRRIGQGSYGEVWLARNVVGTWRAVKVVYLAHFEDSRPYDREFSGIQKYEPVSRTNDGLVDVLQIGRNDAEGYFYYVMELADAAAEREDRSAVPEASNAALAAPGGAKSVGCRRAGAPFVQDPRSYVPRTLAHEIRARGRLPVEECITLGITLNLALGHLHRHGLIHRDIKPSNIIFVNGVPKLADLGLVTAPADAQSFVGTEGFVPPEGPNSGPADLYALGKVLYEASMGKDRTEFPEPFTSLAMDAESRALMELNVVILKACAANLKQRYRSAEEMNADLALLHSGKSVRDKHALERRLRIMTRAGAALVGVVLLGAVPYYLAIRGARLARVEAAKSKQVARFLKDMLEAAGPSVAKGRDTTLLREILDKTAARIDGGLPGQPEAEVEVRNILAGVYEELGLFESEEKMARAALRTVQTHLGPETPAAATALGQIGDALSHLGKWQEAEQFMRQGVALGRRVWGSGGPNLAGALSGLGVVLTEEGKRAEAEALLREAVQINRRTLAPDHLNTAAVLQNLARTLWAEGKLPESEALLHESLAMMKRLPDAAAFDMAHVQTELAGVLDSQGRSVEAESLAQEAVTTYREAAGPEHFVVAVALNTLAAVLMHEGKEREAEPAMRESLAISLKTLGPEHPNVTTAKGNLAVLLSKLHKLAEAEPLMLEVVAQQSKPPGVESLTLATSLNNLATMLRDAGKLGAAVDKLGEALAMKRKLAGNNDPDVHTILLNLGDTLRRAGRLTDAEAMFRDGLDVCRQQLAADHPDIARGLYQYALVLRDQHRLDEAEANAREAVDRLRKRPHRYLAGAISTLALVLQDKGTAGDAEELFRECLAIRRKDVPPGWTLFATQAELGHCLLNRKRFVEAEEALLQAYQGFRRHEEEIPPVEKSRITETVSLLLKLYEALDRPDQAAEWRQTLAEIGPRTGASAWPSAPADSGNRVGSDPGP